MLCRSLLCQSLPSIRSQKLGVFNLSAVNERCTRQYLQSHPYASLRTSIRLFPPARVARSMAKPNKSEIIH